MIWIVRNSSGAQLGADLVRWVIPSELPEVFATRDEIYARTVAEIAGGVAQEREEAAPIGRCPMPSGWIGREWSIK